MALFTDADIQGFADLGTELALKDDCTILEDIEGALDSMGGAEHTPFPRMDTSVYPVQDTTKCAVLDWRPPSQDYVIANQVVGLQLKKVLFPLGTKMAKNNHLLVKGVVYKVVDPIEDSSYSVFTEVVAVVTTLGV